MVSYIPDVTKLTRRVTRILGCNPGPMTLQGTNTYLIGTGKRRMLLDTGDGNVPQYINHLSQVLQNENVGIDQILISHWHHDHIGGISEVSKLSEQGCKAWKFKRTDAVNEAEVNNVPLNYLEDGEELTTEGATLRILHTPGHTTDHVVALLKEENILFSADCVLGEGTAVFEDLYDYKASLQKILALGSNVIYPGHGPVIQNPNEKIQEYIDHRDKRELQIMQVLDSSPNNLSEMDIVKEIYQEIPETLHQAAAVNVKHHLTKLLKEGRVKQKGSGWQTIKA